MSLRHLRFRDVTMTEKQFRQIALALDDAIEGTHMGHPDFRAFGRIFATLHDDRQTGMIKLTPAEQQQFMSRSTAFSPENGAWGRSGCTRVVLASVDPEALGEAMTLAWRNVAEKSKQRSPAATRTRRRVAGGDNGNVTRKRAVRR